MNRTPHDFWYVSFPWESLAASRWQLKVKEFRFEHRHCPLGLEDHADSINTRLVSVRARHRQPADFLHAGGVGLVCGPRVRAAFAEAGLRGYELRPVELFLPGQKEPDRANYAEFRVTGRGGVASPASGVVLIDLCPGCDRHRYRIPHPDRIIDPAACDGSDFFIVWPLTGFIFCSAATRDVILQQKLKGIELVPATEIPPGTRDDEFWPHRLSTLYSAEEAAAIRRRFGIEAY
jgi:hypothetical protein